MMNVLRSSLPLLRALAILADVAVIVVMIVLLRSERGTMDATAALVFAAVFLATGTSAAVLLLTKPDPEERQLEADVRKAELRKRLRDLDSTNQRSQ